MFSKTKILSGALGALLVAGFATAQSLVTYDSAANAIDTLCVVGSPLGGACPAGIDAVPPRPATAFPAGAVTANHPGGLVLMTNGVSNIVRIRHPRVGCPGSVPTFPPLPIPPPYNPAFAPITGMTMDPMTQFIYLTDGYQVSAHNPAAGMALVWGPMPTVGINLVTGLDFDSCTGNLLMVDDLGGVGVLSPAGIILAYLPWMFPAPVGSQATGVAIDRTPGNPCGPLIPSHYVSWSTGVVIHAVTGLALATSGLGAQGLSFAGVPVRLPSPAGMLVSARASEFMRELEPFNVMLCGIPLGAAPLGLLVSFAPIPGGMPILGEVLWLMPAGPAIPGVVVAAAAVAVAVPPLPYGFPTPYTQWALLNPAGGIELSNALELEIPRR